MTPEPTDNHEDVYDAEVDLDAAEASFVDESGDEANGEPGRVEVSDDDGSIAEAEAEPAEDSTSPNWQGRSRRVADDMGDAVAVAGPSERQASASDATPLVDRTDRSLTPQRIAVELKRIESDVRKLLDDRDPKRKRRLAGSRRWRELEDDLVSLRYAGRMDESTLNQLSQLVQRRHYLFGRLRFLAMTRPTWNT